MQARGSKHTKPSRCLGGIAKRNYICKFIYAQGFFPLIFDVGPDVQLHSFYHILDVSQLTKVTWGLGFCKYSHHPGGTMTTAQAPVNNRREIFGWAMYDWANSAFSTTIGSVFLGPYVRGLAATVAEADFLARTGTAWTETSGQPLVVNFLGLPVAPEAVIAFAISLSVVFQAGFLPILGAIADYSHRRKQMLQVFATIGALSTTAMFFITLNTWILGPILFVIANLAFGAALVFYNAYLPDIASEEERDRVSSYGFALGYIGGFVLLALN